MRYLPVQWQQALFAIVVAAPELLYSRASNKSFLLYIFQRPRFEKFVYLHAWGSRYGSARVS